MSETTNDKQLLNKLITGDEDAFEEVYKQYFPHLRNYSLSIVNDVEVAFDIVQNVFVYLWENKKSLDPEKSLRNYLLSSVRNNSIRHLNKLSLHQQHNKQFMIEEMIMSDSHITIEHEEADEAARVESLLNQLPERSRQITFMSRIEEKKNNEIANELNLSVRTVETIIYKSIKKLRKLAKS